jgi:hypothetical protein
MAIMTTMEAASNPTRAPTPLTEDLNVLADTPKAAAEQATITHEAKSGIDVTSEKKREIKIILKLENIFLATLTQFVPMFFILTSIASRRKGIDERQQTCTDKVPDEKYNVGIFPVRLVEGLLEGHEDEQERQRHAHCRDADRILPPTDGVGLVLIPAHDSNEEDAGTEEHPNERHSELADLNASDLHPASLRVTALGSNLLDLFFRLDISHRLFSTLNTCSIRTV